MIIDREALPQTNMATVRNIYKTNKFDYKKELENVNKTPTSTYNKQIILSWHNHLSAGEAELYRICKLSTQIRRLILAWHDKTDTTADLSTITKDSFEPVIAWINIHPDWSPATKADYRRCVKQFFFWYEEKDPRLKGLPEIDITSPEAEQKAQFRARQEAIKKQEEAKAFYAYLRKDVKRNYKTPEHAASEIITEADIRTVIQRGAKNSRDRALLGVLHEGGFRAAELLNIQIKDLRHEQDRVLVFVNGKTGRRAVPIIVNFPYLLRWLDDHPHKDSIEAYLWVGLSSKNKNEPLFHSAVSRMVHKAFIRAGVKKKHNLHWFRHSRASLYYGRMTEGEMCDFFGWQKGSDMIKTYSHTNNDSAENALNRIYNLQSRKHEEVLLTCAACGLHNKEESQFCSRCGQPLSTDAHKQKENYVKLAFKMLGKVMSDPALKKEFEQYVEGKNE